MVELFVNQFDIKGLNVHLLSDLVISSFGIFLRQVKKNIKSFREMFVTA